MSDTHLPRFGRALPRALVDGFEARGVDHVLHAGDWTDPMAVALLEALVPVDGVAGNNDGPELHERFGTHATLQLDGARIGLTHGHLGAGRTTPERAAGAFEGRPLDAIVFGHSHIPLVQRIAAGTWLANPGSPTDKRRQPDYTWGVMTIEHGAVSEIEIMRFRERVT